MALAAAAAAAADVPLLTIIERTPAVPTIVNEASKFVVVTYWWGRGNLNKNTARPCLEFYESLLLEPFKHGAKVVIAPDLLPRFNWMKWFSENAALLAFYETKARKYVRESGKRANNVESYKTHKRVILRIVTEAFDTNKAHVNTLLEITHRQNALRLRVQELEEEGEDVTEVLAEVRALAQRYKEANGALKAAVRPFIAALETALMYKPPITYEAMIENWRTKCRDNNCNYLDVEYPEFALKGGYQKAINAKPLFIQKALAACAPRAVVYIDGDMTINKYPHIFDIDDVDYMARGWHIDPRSSWKYTIGDIMVDPYTFETSGGIMYFSQTPEAHRLLDAWVGETARPSQAGKADDRIISLIFNTKRLLAPMKIIQLPVEFLWLSMDYDYSIEEDDFDRAKIYVEHPECLTSEDTAAGSGASSNRTPKYYSGIETTYPRSETLYESVMFPNSRVAEEFRPWLDYIGRAVYTDKVVDEDLIDEHPFYVYGYGDFGARRNTILRNNLELVARTENISTNSNKRDKLIVLDNTTFTIPNILRQLNLGHEVLYVPTTTKDVLLAAINRIYQAPDKKRLEFVFVDTNKNIKEETIFQYEIDLTQPMLIRPAPHVYMMFALLADVSEIKDVLKHNYQFLSRIRCHVLKPARMVGGGDIAAADASNISRNTDDALNFLYGSNGATATATVGGGKAKRKGKSTRRKHRSHRQRTRRNIRKN